MDKYLVESLYNLYYAELRRDRKALDRETVQVLRDAIQRSIDRWIECLAELEMVADR